MTDTLLVSTRKGLFRVERKSGAIVNISSGAAIGPGRGPYKNATVFRGGL